MLLHERLLLLALDDVKGTNGVSFVEKGLAGAVLFELLRVGAVELADDRVRVGGGALPADDVLRDAVAAIAAEERARDVRWWVDHLPARLSPFLPRLAARLVDSGVLSEEHHKVLGIFPTTRLPERDHAPEAQVRDRLRAVLLGSLGTGDAVDADDAELAGMVSALGMVEAIVGRDRRKEAERRARELAENAALGEAVGKSIKAAQDAVMAAIIASTVATTVAATASS